MAAGGPTSVVDNTATALATTTAMAIPVTTGTIAATHAPRNIETDTKANNTHPGQEQGSEQWPQFIDPKLLMKNPTMPQGLGSNWNDNNNGSTSNNNKNASQKQFSFIPTDAGYLSSSTYNCNNNINDNGLMAAVSGGEGVQLDKDLLNFNFGEFDPASFGIDENSMMFFGQQLDQQQQQNLANITTTAADTTTTTGAVVPNMNMNMNMNATTDTAASVTPATPVAHNQNSNLNLVYSNNIPQVGGQAAAQGQGKAQAQQNPGFMMMNNLATTSNPSSQYLSLPGQGQEQTPRQQYTGNSGTFIHPQMKRLF